MCEKVVGALMEVGAVAAAGWVGRVVEGGNCGGSGRRMARRKGGRGGGWREIKVHISRERASSNWDSFISCFTDNLFLLGLLLSRGYRCG